MDTDITTEEQRAFLENHLTHKEVQMLLGLKLTGSTLNKHFTKVKIPKEVTRTKRIKDIHHMYKKSEVHALLDYNESIKKNHMTTVEAIKYLGIPHAKFNALIKKFDMKSINLKLNNVSPKYYSKTDIEKLMEIKNLPWNDYEDIDSKSKEQKDFFQNHISFKDTCKALGTKHFDSYITRVKIPDGYPKPNGSGQSIYMYSLEDVIKLKEHNDFILNNCLCFDEFGKYLDVTQSTFKQIAEAFDLKSRQMIFVKTSPLYYTKQDIEKIRTMQISYWQEFISSAELRTVYKINNVPNVFRNLKRYDVPIYAKTISNSNSYCYKREEVLKHLEALKYAEKKAAEDKQLKALKEADNMKAAEVAKQRKSLKDAEKKAIEDLKHLETLKEVEKKKAAEGLKHFKALKEAEIKEFYEKHMTRKEACKFLSASEHILDHLTKAKIPDSYPKPKGSPTSTYMYSKEDVFNLKKHNENVLEEYMSSTEAAKYLNLTPSIFKQMIKKSNLAFDTLKGKTNERYYLKSDLDIIKSKQKDFWDKNISSIQLSEVYGYARKTIPVMKKRLGLDAITVPTYARTNDAFRKNSTGNFYCFNKKETLKILDELKIKKLINDTSGKTYFETFILRMGINVDKLAKFNSSLYTKKKLFDFVEKRLKDTQAPRTANSRINLYVRIAEILNNALKEYNLTEIYALNANQLYIVYNGANGEEKSRLYKFFLAVEEDVIQQLSKSGINGAKGFDVSKIADSIRKTTQLKNEEKDKESDTQKNMDIFNFETYSIVFKFLTNIELHTINSLECILDKKSIIYPSVWLYLLLHMNNAWRHGDNADFPRLHISDLLTEFEIDGPEWFNENKITLSQARRVITRMIQEELVISKTQMKGHFFSSDVIAPAVATVILIIESFLISHGILDSDKEYLPLLNFGTKFNQPSTNQLKNFFKPMNYAGNFTFKSKKMNKTVMSFIYHLCHMSGDDDAMKFVQALRGHIDKNSPLDYVNFNIEAVESLTSMMLSNGPFGFIPGLIAQKLKGEQLSLQEMSKEIHRINNAFNDVFTLEHTVAFLNSVRYERESVIRIIEGKSLRECQKLLTDIFSENLPSKEDDIQCLMSKQGCVHSKKKCFDCVYHIPSIYALTSLCLAITSNLKEYYATTNKLVQLQIANRIERELVVYQEAIQKYGREYVYSCIGLSRDELWDKLGDIPTPDEILEEISIVRNVINKTQ